MPTPIWSTELRGDKLLFDRPAEFRKWLLSQKRGRYELTVRRMVVKRGNAANRFYWGVILEEAARQTGDEKAAIHEWLKQKIVPLSDRSSLGIVKTESTADMDEERFAWFTERAIAVLAQHGVDMGGIREVEA